MPQGIWRFQIEEPYERAVPQFDHLVFSNRWLTIVDGVLTVSAGYAWDGCTPAYYLPLVGWVSVPNGAKNAHGVPAAYHASLVHDALCQFREELDLSKADAVALFVQMLIEGGFPKWAARLYGRMVSWFGPQKWRGREPLRTAFD